MSNTETIAAIATPIGIGGVGIIRISGTKAVEIALQLSQKTDLKPRYATFTPFYDQQNDILDSGILLYFPAPHSFTGEDVIELQGHGGAVIQDMLLKAVLHAGARMAEPGEFSLRAYLNDKIDLLQAEAIADLIESRTTSAARSATRSLQGQFSKEIHHLVEKVTQLRLFIEAAIDFPDEDIDFLKEGNVLGKLNHLIEILEQILSKTKTGIILREGLKVVIAGLPNVGKSSLMNQLAESESAIVTDIAGTTRDLIKEDIQIQGIPIHLIDTAGIRETNNIVEQQGISRALTQIETADHIVWCYDALTNPDNQGYQPSQFPQHIPITFVRNKIDLLNESPQATDHQISLSAKQGDGISLLQHHLVKEITQNPTSEGQFIARRRHLDLLEQALSFLHMGRQQIELTGSGELVADDLRETQNTLGEITGKFTSDQLLGEIFGHFCIGK